MVDDIDFDTARTLADLGAPPETNDDRRPWVKSCFVRLGAVWYSVLHDDPRGGERRDELEALAVELLQANSGHLPGISSLKSAASNWSWFPSTVQQLWDRAFPPSAEERARESDEWRWVEATTRRINTLRAEGNGHDAEALRVAAVTFFNKYLADTETDAVVRHYMRRSLRKH